MYCRVAYVFWGIDMMNKLMIAVPFKWSLFPWHIQKILISLNCWVNCRWIA